MVEIPSEIGEVGTVLPFSVTGVVEVPIEGIVVCAGALSRSLLVNPDIDVVDAPSVAIWGARIDQPPALAGYREVMVEPGYDTDIVRGISYQVALTAREHGTSDKSMLRPDIYEPKVS